MYFFLIFFLCLPFGVCSFLWLGNGIKIISRLLPLHICASAVGTNHHFVTRNHRVLSEQWIVGALIYSSIIHKIYTHTQRTQLRHTRPTHNGTSFNFFCWEERRCAKRKAKAKRNRHCAASPAMGFFLSTQNFIFARRQLYIINKMFWKYFGSSSAARSANTHTHTLITIDTLALLLLHPIFCFFSLLSFSIFILSQANSHDFFTTYFRRFHLFAHSVRWTSSSGFLNSLFEIAFIFLYKSVFVFFCSRFVWNGNWCVCWRECVKMVDIELYDG